MATKVERKPAAATGRKSNAAAEDLDILHPERQATIAGRKLVIREYGFVEGLKIRANAQPFLESLYEFTKGSEGRAPGFVEAEQLLASCYDQVIPLIAAAADVEPEWIQGLNDEDGYHLMQEWWLATAGFFIRRVVQRLATERAVARLAGPRSTTR